MRQTIALLSLGLSAHGGQDYPDAANALAEAGDSGWNTNGKIPPCPINIVMTSKSESANSGLGPAKCVCQHRESHWRQATKDKYGLTDSDFICTVGQWCGTKHQTDVKWLNHHLGEFEGLNQCLDKGDGTQKAGQQPSGAPYEKSGGRSTVCAPVFNPWGSHRCRECFLTPHVPFAVSTSTGGVSNYPYRHSRFVCSQCSPNYHLDIPVRDLVFNNEEDYPDRLNVCLPDCTPIEYCLNYDDPLADNSGGYYEREGGICDLNTGVRSCRKCGVVQNGAGVPTAFAFYQNLNNGKGACVDPRYHANSGTPSPNTPVAPTTTPPPTKPAPTTTKKHVKPAPKKKEDDGRNALLIALLVIGCVLLVSVVALAIAFFTKRGREQEIDFDQQEEEMRAKRSQGVRN